MSHQHGMMHIAPVYQVFQDSISNHYCLLFGNTLQMNVNDDDSHNIQSIVKKDQ